MIKPPSKPQEKASLIPKFFSLKETILQVFESEEEFYSKYFRKIKTLVERNISYGDSHLGNIMPNLNDPQKEMLLIDFDASKMFKNTQMAKAETMESTFNKDYLKNFKQLESLSLESKKLIVWFSSKDSPVVIV